MRLRKIAAATLLALQALVASRPFVSLSPEPTAGSPHASMVVHHAAASDMPADCHHDAASHEQQPDAPAPHDHGDSACHAGTPCCAPTLPLVDTELPSATVAARASSTVVHAGTVRAYAFARRLPPATAPPARS